MRMVVPLLWLLLAPGSASAADPVQTASTRLQSHRAGDAGALDAAAIAIDRATRRRITRRWVQTWLLRSEIFAERARTAELPAAASEALGEALVSLEQVPYLSPGESELVAFSGGAEQLHDTARRLGKRLETTHPAEALRCYEVALEARNLRRRVTKSGDGDWQTELDAGLVAGAAGDQATMIRRLRGVISTPADTPVLYAPLARAMWENGDLQAALAVLQTGQERYPAFDEIVRTRLEVLRAAGREGERLEAIEAALVSRPDDPILLVERARALQELGRGPEAIATLRRVVGRAPGKADAWYYLGLLVRDLGLSERKAGRIEEGNLLLVEAIKCWETARVLAPTDTRILAQLGPTWVLLGDLDRYAEARAASAAVIAPE